MQGIAVSPFVNKTDEEIASLVKAGSVEIFSVLVDRYEGKMTRYARKFLSDKEDIEDVVQRVFLKCFENIKSFDEKRKFSPWIYRIAHNELVNVLKVRHKKTLPLFDLDTFLPSAFLIKNDNIEERIDAQAVKQMVEKCLETLEFKYKEPVALYYLEGLSYKEISDVMRIPISTVGVRIKRAKKNMKSFCNNLNNFKK